MPEIPLGHLILCNIGGLEYPVAAPDDPLNVLTVRDSRDSQRTLIPRTEWQFAHTVNGKLTLSNRYIHLNSGFQPGKIYEYVYVVTDPVVAGAGFAVIRDFASYAKHTPDAITPAARVYGEGKSSYLFAGGEASYRWKKPDLRFTVRYERPYVIEREPPHGSTSRVPATRRPTRTGGKP